MPRASAATKVLVASRLAPEIETSSASVRRIVSPAAYMRLVPFGKLTLVSSAASPADVRAESPSRPTLESEVGGWS